MRNYLHKRSQLLSQSENLRRVIAFRHRDFNLDATYFYRMGTTSATICQDRPRPKGSFRNHLFASTIQNRREEYQQRN